jgi:hypothetical protein
MNNIEKFKKNYLRKIVRNSPIRWKKVGFVMLPHELLFDVNLPRPALMVYWVLMVHQFQGKEGCHPSLKLLEQETRYSRPAIISAIKALESQGWLDVERHHLKVNKYYVKLKSEFPPQKGNA